MQVQHRIKIAVYFFAKHIGFFRLSRFLLRRKLLILGYHGFQYFDEAHFRPILFMDPSRFARRLDHIRRSGHPVLTLDEGLRRLFDGTLPSNAVVITIDDGFFSVLDLAAPILRNYGFPATLYVTSYYVAKRTPIFRLAIQYMFWRTNLNRFDAPGYPWSPDSEVRLDKIDEAHAAMWRIIEYGETKCDENTRQVICATVAQTLEVDYEAICASRALSLLNTEELAQLDDFCIDVQLHTHRHTFPADQSTVAEKELHQNKSILEPSINGRLTHFCYPSGVWSRDTFKILDCNGITSATTCDPGMNDVTTHPLALYRFLDQDDLSDIEFEAELTGFSELVRILTGRRRKSNHAHRRMIS